MALKREPKPGQNMGERQKKKAIQQLGAFGKGGGAAGPDGG